MTDLKPTIASLLAGSSVPPPRFHGGGIGIPIGQIPDKWLKDAQDAQNRLYTMQLQLGSDVPLMQPQPRVAMKDAHWILAASEGGEVAWAGLEDTAHGGRAGDFNHLESYRSDVASLARFSQRIDYATWHLSAACHFHIEQDLWYRAAAKARPKNWLGALAGQCFARWKTARNLLLHDRAVEDEAGLLYRAGFWSLCELTPADTQLKHLFDLDPMRASQELVKHVDAYVAQLTLATDLADILEEEADDARRESNAQDDDRLSTVQAALIAKAGGSLSLTEAAEQLGISRQAVHKKIGTDALLGLMVGDTLALPRAQFIEKGAKAKPVAHLREVLSLFTRSGAGPWSALQYLVEPDPALDGHPPIDGLKEGWATRVVAAARAFLGLDEG